MARVTNNMAQTEHTPKIKYTTRGGSVLGIGLHTWEHVMLWSLLAAALSAFAVVFSTTCVVWLQRTENERANRELEAYKTSATAEIAAAEAQGKVAEQKAAEANDRAASLENETEKLRSANLALEEKIQPKPRPV